MIRLVRLNVGWRMRVEKGGGEKLHAFGGKLSAVCFFYSLTSHHHHHFHNKQHNRSRHTHVHTCVCVCAHVFVRSSGFRVSGQEKRTRRRKKMSMFARSSNYKWWPNRGFSGGLLFFLWPLSLVVCFEWPHQHRYRVIIAGTHKKLLLRMKIRTKKHTQFDRVNSIPCQRESLQNAFYRSILIEINEFYMHRTWNNKKKTTVDICNTKNTHSKIVLKSFKCQKHTLLTKKKWTIIKLNTLWIYLLTQPVLYNQCNKYKKEKHTQKNVKPASQIKNK